MLTVEKKWYVCLDSADVIIMQCSSHSPNCSIPILVTGSILDEETIKVRLHHHARVSIAVDTNAWSYTVPTNVEHTGVWCEVSL